MSLALIGGRGSGKTSCAKRLARRNRNFVLFSLDDLVRYEAAGESIPEIIREHGWQRFRELEYKVLCRTAHFPRSLLLDCGGGIVADLDERGREIFSERKVELLRGSARVVYLRRGLEYLIERSDDDAERPPLSESESFAEIMARRESWYRRAAHWTLDCDELDKGEIVTQILAWFYRECGHANPETLAAEPRASDDR